MTSLGRVGRILAGSVDVSNASIEKESSQSTVLSNTQQSINPSVSSQSPDPNKSDENAMKEDNRESPVPSVTDSNNIVFQGKTKISKSLVHHNSCDRARWQFIW